MGGTGRDEGEGTLIPSLEVAADADMLQKRKQVHQETNARHDVYHAPNASDAEIGSKDDPSRAAINRMQETDVPSSGVPGDRDNKIDNQNKFSATGGDTSA